MVARHHIDDLSLLFFGLPPLASLNKNRDFIFRLLLYQSKRRFLHLEGYVAILFEWLLSPWTGFARARGWSVGPPVGCSSRRAFYWTAVSEGDGSLFGNSRVSERTLETRLLRSLLLGGWTIAGTDSVVNEQLTIRSLSIFSQGQAKLLRAFRRTFGGDNGETSTGYLQLHVKDSAGGVEVAQVT